MCCWNSEKNLLECHTVISFPKKKKKILLGHFSLNRLIFTDPGSNSLIVPIWINLISLAFKEFYDFQHCNTRSTTPKTSLLLSSLLLWSSILTLKQLSKCAGWWTDEGRACHINRDPLFNHPRQKYIKAADLERVKTRITSFVFRF